MFPPSSFFSQVQSDKAHKYAMVIERLLNLKIQFNSLPFDPKSIVFLKLTQYRNEQLPKKFSNILLSKSIVDVKNDIKIYLRLSQLIIYLSEY